MNWKIFYAIAFSITLVACGDSSNNGKADNEKPENADRSQLESFDDLPNCSKSREGLVVEILDEKKAYECIDGRWELVGDLDDDALDSYKTDDDLPNCSSKNADALALVEKDSTVRQCVDRRWEVLGTVYETSDDLPNCSSKREGKTAYVIEDKGVVVCQDGRWEDVSVDSPEKDSGESENDGKSSSSSKKGKSSSSAQGGSIDDSDDDSHDVESSSSKTESSSGTDLTASSQQTDQTTCGESAYTVHTAGPHGNWGDFGYVLPLKITTSKTQTLYLAFDTMSTYINGPYGWDKYSVLIAQYDSKNSVWVKGTEVFSKSMKDATPLALVQYSTVNTYGQFEKFEFTVKDTWLEKNAGKTVDVVVNFYAPGVESDSSGMGLDFYAIPVKHPRLYYSYENNGCGLSVKGAQEVFHMCLGKTNSNTSGIGEIERGDTIVWNLQKQMSYNRLSPYVQINWISDIGKLVKVVGDSSLYVYYPDLGVTHDTAEVIFLGKKYKYACPENPTNIKGMSQVVAAGIKGCSCTSNVESVDVSAADGGGTVTWTVSGCKSASAIKQYKWRGAEMKTATTATYTFAGEKMKVTPSVQVINDDLKSVDVTCPMVRGVDPNDPDYIFKQASSAASIVFPAGSHIVEFNLPKSTNGSVTYMECLMMCNMEHDYSSGDRYGYIEVAGQAYQVSDFTQIDLPLEYCNNAVDIPIEFSAVSTCYISAW